MSFMKVRNVCLGVLECIETEYKHSLPEHSPLTDNKINMTHHTNIAYQRGPCISPHQAHALGILISTEHKVRLLVFFSRIFSENVEICLTDWLYVWAIDKNNYILLSKQPSLALQSMHFIIVIPWVISIIYCRIDEFLTWKL